MTATQSDNEWFELLEASADWYHSASVAFQVDGKDIVHVSDIDKETGEATVRVFASTAEHAEVIFAGKVNVKEHLGGKDGS